MSERSLHRDAHRSNVQVLLLFACALCVMGAAPVASAAGAASPQRATTTTPGSPRFFNYQSPLGTADNAGEPSLGMNWTTEHVFTNSNGPIPNGGTANYFGGFLPYMVKVTFDDCQSPAKATWEQKPLLTANTPRVFGDPILFTDHVTGRTLVSQLEGLTPAGSTTDLTDNDGDSFTPSEGSGAPSCVDHQTIGGGPFHAPLTGTALYPNAVYYASQCIADATCAISLDGGRTFAASVPMFTVADCDGLHGHIKVAPDGTVYVPDKGCSGNVPLVNGGQPAAVVSENNGVTWNIRTIPDGTSPGEWDPSLGIATDGTVYLGYQGLNGHAMIAVSHDRGVHWSSSFDVGTQQGIQNIAFPAVVAGDPDRATFAFYGTTTADGPGESHNGGANGDDATSFSGLWYLFIATTFDGGQTWTTQNVTPGEPVQRGPICGSGTCRNLLDFFDATIDKEGRVLVGWDDGCIGGCEGAPPNSFTAKATITRQCGGKRMFAAYDPVEPALALAPGAGGVLSGSVAELSWSAPDDGGSAITAYNVYRRIGTNPFALIATVGTTHYTDTVNPTEALFYRVTAVNGLGEGPYCHDITLDTPPPTPCTGRGIMVINDLNPDGTDADAGQNTPPDGSVNVKQLWVGEPYLGPGVNQLVLTLQVAPSLLSSPPANSQWFIIWNALNPNTDFDRRYVAMRTDVAGAISFEYGKFGVPLDPTNPNTNANTPVLLGAADEGSYDQATGVIRIVLANDKAESIQAGQSLVGLNVRTYLNRPDPGPRAQNNASDITGNSNYTLAGNASCFCAVDRSPVASLVASPESGPTPLTVHFDASGSSDPDVADGDAVASYTFDFGDGSSPVTQSSPTLTHTYTAASGPSGYFVTLTCKDQKCGTQSLNVASANIEVNSGGTTAAPPAKPVAFGLAPQTNPSRGQVFFDLGLDRDGTVNVQAFSAAGSRVANLLDAWMPAGRHMLHWRGIDNSGRHLAPGVYLFRARSGGHVATTRVVLLQ
jgi:hypothetical protein